MSLRLKRNLPTILLLITFLSFLVFATGNLHIASYSLRLLIAQSANDTSMHFDDSDDDISMVNLPLGRFSQISTISQCGEELVSSLVDLSSIYQINML